MVAKGNKKAKASSKKKKVGRTTSKGKKRLKSNLKKKKATKKVKVSLPKMPKLPKVPKAKKKRTRKKYGLILEYRGVPIGITFSNTIRLLREDLRLKGCFYSYSDLIRMSLEHIRYYIFYQHYAEVFYPCTKHFLESAKNHFFIEKKDYFHNDGLDEVEYFRDIQPIGSLFYFRGLVLSGQARRFKEYLGYYEAISDEYTKLWRAADAFVEANDVPSPQISVYVAYERITNMIFIDFSQSEVSGHKLYEFLQYVEGEE